MQKEKLILLGSTDTQAAQLKRLADNMRISIIHIDERYRDALIKDIYEGTALLPAVPVTSENALSSDAASSGGRSLLIFANVTEKHMDKLLFELKSRKISVDYKAVMTETNREWNLRRLLFELERERKAFNNQ